MLSKDTIIDMLVSLRQEHDEMCSIIYDSWVVDNVSSEYLAQLDKSAEQKKKEIEHFENLLRA